ncbi:ZPR1 zinc-finger domain containing protein, putative [Babesia ovis]|uniref:ZPR1 zinc-finger domain containing protein, putative n=1 Tax=Babesia ovis TaxID=5869 RepID=A0A9W5WUV0_BABOV|nr:ZPR1 zinc-finger domain containing protein, putative [Babesia ovis]
MADSNLFNAVSEATSSLMTDRAVIESACIKCGAMGLTMICLSMIPHFKEVLSMSFECKSCGYINRESQNAAALQDYGVKITAKVTTPAALRNQVVMSGMASYKFEELDFEFQPTGDQGSVTTIEGCILRIAESIGDQIESIAEAMRENAGLEIEVMEGTRMSATEFILEMSSRKQRLLDYAEGTEQFTIIFDDPSGNTYVEETDSLRPISERYRRTAAQQEMMGYAVKEDSGKELDLTQPLEDDADVGEEGISLPVDCPHCGKGGLNRICTSRIPGFGKFVIMSFQCDHCGAKSTELQSGEGYKELAKKWTLKVEGQSDLNRDVIISSTATICIPHLDLVMAPGTIGAVFTTVEGLLLKVAESLESAYPFLVGDSAQESSAPLKEKVQQLKELASGEQSIEFTLIVDDPADHSFVSAPISHIGEDTKLITESYERTAEQNDALGITDMKTENY